MYLYWKFRNKILIFMCTDVGGFASERLRHELTWERTVNIHGKKGCNIPQDYANELINCDFKGTKLK